MQRLEDFGLKKTQVDKASKGAQWIKEFFNGKAPSRGIKPREIVAYGAAVQAAILSEEVVRACCCSL